MATLPPQRSRRRPRAAAADPTPQGSTPATARALALELRAELGIAGPATAADTWRLVEHLAGRVTVERSAVRTSGCRHGDDGPARISLAAGLDAEQEAREVALLVGLALLCSYDRFPQLAALQGYERLKALHTERWAVASAFREAWLADRLADRRRR